MKSMKANQYASPVWRILIPGITLLLLTACSGGGGGGESGGSDPGTGSDDPSTTIDKNPSGSDDPGTTIDKNASVSARSASLALGDPTCPHGGFEIETGIDENGNGLLDDEEVDKTAKVCNGAPGEDGLMALVAMEDEPAGANCPAGGLRIRSGHDANRNGVLDGDEVAVTDYLCNGQNGPAGPAGPAGADGRNSLVTMTPEPAGSNCASGGLRIESGLDTNGNGNLDTGEITQTGYICNGSDGSMVGWSNSTPLQVSSRNASEVDLAMFDDGAAIAVWTEEYAAPDTGSRILSSIFDPKEGTWNLPDWISGSTSTYVSQPRINMIPSVYPRSPYNAVAIWRERVTSTEYSVQVSSILDWSLGWGGTGNLVTAFYVSDPEIATDDSGNSIAIWIQKDSASAEENLMAALSDGLRTFNWGSAQNIESNSGKVLSPQIAMNADGHAVVVWQQWNQAEAIYNLWVTRYVPGTGWVGLERLDDGSGFIWNPEVAITPDGKAIVIWAEDNGSDVNILVSHYTPGTGWSTPEPVESSANSASQPHVAIDASGNAMAVWTQKDGTSTNVYARRYDASTSQWGAIELLDTNDFTAYSPKVAMTSTGDAIVVWTQSDGSRLSLWSRNYDASTATWGRTQLAETDNTGSIWPPEQVRLAMDENGNAIAAWPQLIQYDFHIRTSRWQAPAP